MNPRPPVSALAGSLLLGLLLHAAAAAAAAQDQPAAPAMDTTWSAWHLVLGDWVAETGGGAPGTASAGGDSFHPALSGRVLERRYWSAYPATGTRPASRNEGLMIVYRESGGFRAIAFDNEGHVIHYVAEATDSLVSFVSDNLTAGTPFRLTFRPVGPDRVGIRFEVGSESRPGFFRTYVEGTARRQR